MINLRCVLPLVAFSVVSASANDDHAHHQPEDLPSSGGSWFLAPFEHIHFSELGTPMVHSFGVEPALTGRDFFLNYRYRDGIEITGDEVEAELEWAFTRRLGLIVELPFIREEGDDSVNGLGDLALVPRATLYEQDRFLLTAQVEFVLPTGSDDFGGETAFAPGIATWIDLGNWWTLNSQLGVEHVLDEDLTELIFGFGLVKSFGHSPAHDHASTSGLFNLHLEVTGSVELSGEDKGTVSAEGLLGFSHGLTSSTDLRLGYEFPLTSPRDFDGGFVAGLVWHF